MSLLIHHLKYQQNSAELFSRLSHQPWAILLDSGQPESQYGRYDILVADPFVTIITRESGGKIKTEITQNGEVKTSDEEPFVILNQLLMPYQSAQSNFPFSGGALGYFAYDLARQVEHLPNLSVKNERLPHMMVGIYDWAVVVDHREKTACLVSHGFQQSTRDHWQNLCGLFDAPASPHLLSFALTSPVVSNMNESLYGSAFKKIKDYITDGDCYQVNLAQRFSANAKGDGWVAYNKLREISPCSFYGLYEL